MVTLEANQPTVSGRTINVAIKQLDIGQSVTIKYGTDEDEKESEKAVLHHVANDAIRISGTFRVSSSAGTRTTSTGNDQAEQYRRRYRFCDAIAYLG